MSHKTLPQIILGSKSPRRAEILGFFSLKFDQIASDFDEEAVPFNGDPEHYAAELSNGKAETLSKQYSNAIIIAADTIVFREGKIYGKPANESEAISFFNELMGQWHTVYTSVTVRCGDRFFQEVESTRVLFNHLTESEIRHYLTKVTWADKAGGYAIQGAGGLIVRKIEGCFYNVMGLPVNTVESLLKHFGIELWEYL